MNENEAKIFMKIEKECINRNCDRNCAHCDIVQKVEDLNNAYDTAIKALEEVQQYRELGTVEELVQGKKYINLAKQHGTIGRVIKNCIAYEEIGTPEECRTAVEKQTAKKISSAWCPNCKKYLTTQHLKGKYHCVYCGQKLDWSDEE